MGPYVGDGGGAWSTVPVRSRKAAPPAPAPRGGGGDDSALGAGELAEVVEGLEIGGDGERRLDKYDIPVEVSGEGAPPPADGFEAAGLAEAVLRNVSRCGYESPTPVQRYAMPIATAGRDLMACAQTGSGKTAAFCLPIVSGLVAEAGGYGRRDKGSFERTSKPRALVLAPTRELAAQINEEAKKFSFQTGLRVVVAYGGIPMYDQLRNLERGVDLLVATPGRLVDMVERSWISLKAIKYLVMDEADRMLDMGFEPQIRKIVDMMNMPKKSVRQTMLFSTTFPPEIQRLASDFLHNYIFITVGRVGSSTDLIDQKIEFVKEGGKRGFLLERLHKQSVGGTPSKVWNMRKFCKLLIVFWIISLLSMASSASTHYESDVCPIEPIHSYFLPRNTCPVVQVSAEHWVHAKRSIQGSSSNSKWSSFHLSIEDLVYFLVFVLLLISSVVPVLYIFNIQTDITATIFSWETKLLYVWACNLISTIVYHGSWMLFDLIQHLKDTEATKSVWCIIYKHLSICMIYVLLLCTLGYRHRLAVQGYMYTKQATRVWASLIIFSICWFWISIIFHITSLGLVILAWISMVIMYITKFITSKSFKWLSFLLKTVGLVGVIILKEGGKYVWYERAYKVGILCRFIELMLSGYPWAIALKFKVKNRLNR